jgi:CRISPR-associated protein Cas1
MHIVLNSFGTSISKENGNFCIQTPEGKQLFPPRDIKTISISKSARISSDAVLLAIENEIDVLFVDGLGMPQGRIWSVKYGSISDIRQKQVEFLYSTKSIDWVKDLLSEKLNNQIALLLMFQPTDNERLHTIFKKSINSIEDHKNKILKFEGTHLSEIAPSLRGWEGAAAKRYFQAINIILPIKYQFERRSQNPALDAFNSCLNYGYGMLYGKVESALIKAGIDPYMGVFHRDDYNRPALVFDVIEKYRAWIDYTVIQLFLQEAFNEECFTQKQEQVYLDGLGKRILIQSVNDYFSEIILFNKLERSRAVHLELYAHRLAKEFLKH